MDGWKDGRRERGGRDGWIESGGEVNMGKYMCGWMDKCMNEWMEGRRKRRMEGWVDVVCVWVRVCVIVEAISMFSYTISFLTTFQLYLHSQR